MYKSILAISEGGPEAAMSFRLAAMIASMFGGTVDAVHFSETHPGDADIAAQAMPFLKRVTDDRLNARARESERAFKELLASLPGATFTGGHGVTRDQLVTMGRFANLLLLGRPGTDAEHIAPETVRVALYDCARPVVIAPPNPNPAPISSVVVAWNGSVQAARAAGFALPFLQKARTVTILVAGAAPDEVGTPHLLRTLGRHGVAAMVETMDHDAVSGRARGDGLLDYAHDRGANLLVMGAYGHGGVTNLLGLGGATARVIAACPIPLLLAH
jgi:nucleotide-binding universal stress UspA family protein